MKTMKFPGWYLILIVLAGMATSACSAGKRANRYDYLLSENYHQQQEAAADPASPGPVTTGSSNKKRNSPANIAVSTAMSYLGTPYRYGGTTRRGMDCSGLMCVSYDAAGKQLPRTSSQMASSGKKVSRSKLQEGDLVFFSAKKRGGIDHVGMVTSVRSGKVEFIHASTSKGVRIDRMDEGYWAERFRRAIRP